MLRRLMQLVDCLVFGGSLFQVRRSSISTYGYFDRRFLFTKAAIPMLSILVDVSDSTTDSFPLLRLILLLCGLIKKMSLSWLVWSVLDIIYCLFSAYFVVYI